MCLSDSFTDLFISDWTQVYTNKFNLSRIPFFHKLLVFHSIFLLCFLRLFLCFFTLFFTFVLSFSILESRCTKLTNVMDQIMLLSYFCNTMNNPTNNVIKIRFDVNIKPVLTHWRDGFKVIYILIVYCFYGRGAAVGIESG